MGVLLNKVKAEIAGIFKISMSFLKVAKFLLSKDYI